MPRLSPIYQDPMTSLIDDLRFTLKAPIMGWFEATRGTRYERYAEVILNAPPGRAFSRAVKRASLVWTARTMEGGASTDAYFQMLLNMVSQSVRLYADLMPSLAEAIAMIAIVLIVFTGIGLTVIGPLTILGMGMVGFLLWFLAPKDHWLGFSILDAIGIAIATGLGIVTALAGIANLAIPIGLLAYGITVMPRVISDWRLASSAGLRVITSFNELLTKPVPTPLRELSPIEAGLKPLWLDARSLGAPKYVSWANTLVGLYISAVNTTRRLMLIYALMMLGIGLGFSGGLTWYIMANIVSTGASQALVTASQYSGFSLSSMPLQAFYAVIGSGMAGGFAMFDHRTGALTAGVLGLLAWFLLHSFFPL
ncbi:hypothetical protein [Vulcanisaeta souniana]|uniref:Uncharacterized protein n=1 Tax=Vulcanisaeta souniana JCM 11219 TaxID=1293586 RepID=A0A830EIG3_9CREN|nr:hypothetical protein [Vulcanisaeta souniana]BDR92230.1 hypothetical protein Vsou_13230 [Vulcanisaeta souniana JCM 11219]GGI86049.1 hypothetical protein GCM10007112_23800 [Vulcanisaeta souniana JCM 11219]